MSTRKKPSGRSGRISRRAVWTPLVGIGIEFVAVVAVFTFGGYWADQYFQTEPWCRSGGFIFSFIGMTCLIIKRAIQQFYNDSE